MAKCGKYQRPQTWIKTERIKEETEAVGTVIEWQNIRGQARIKTEMIKEETETVGIVI